MSRRALLLGSVSAAPLLMAVPEPWWMESGGWYGAIDAGYHEIVGDYP